MTKLYKTEAEIRREKADGEIRARFCSLRDSNPDVQGVNRFVMTIYQERLAKRAKIRSPRGILLSLRRTGTI